MIKAKLKPSSLSDQLTARLTARIAEGALAPGSRLPTEQELSAEFGVSRNVVREAISRLKSEGLVETRQGAGGFVAQTKLGVPFRIDPASVQSYEATREILELRLAVESEAAALAAERADRKQLKSIRDALDAVNAAFARGDDGVHEDLLFHRAIARAARNGKFVDFTEFLERYVRHQIELTGGALARAARMDATHAEHERIYKAIEARDPEVARALAREHFRKGLERIARSRAR
ncbi:MAG TPA: FadR/GntR family transcriptional regulator [Burkholderiales bacterium]|nr:FadR/GntR family transcriptional regulator [Burkholderiales bacterium]